MQQHRPSILHRPARASASRANEETYELQYQREQAVLKVKQERQEDTRQRLLRSLYPQPEDKAAAWEAMVASNSQLASRHSKPEREEPVTCSSGSRGPVPEGTRPWHHSMATQHYTAADEEAARRRYAAEVAAENQRMAREREVQRAMEQQDKRQPLQDTWYSRGDTHMREQPLFSGNGVPRPIPSPAAGGAPQRPASAVPWATTPNGQTGSSAAPLMAAPSQPQSQQRPASNYPWAWPAADGEAARPQTAAGPSTASQRAQPVYPWATTGDAAVVVRPMTAFPQTKLPEKQYPWSWQT